MLQRIEPESQSQIIVVITRGVLSCQPILQHFAQVVVWQGEDRQDASAEWRASDFGFSGRTNKSVKKPAAIGIH
jgi:hypothetical protein